MKELVTKCPSLKIRCVPVVCRRNVCRGTRRWYLVCEVRQQRIYSTYGVFTDCLLVLPIFWAYRFHLCRFSTWV